jgi:hypothetical protein
MWGLSVRDAQNEKPPPPEQRGLVGLTLAARNVRRRGQSGHDTQAVFAVSQLLELANQCRVLVLRRPLAGPSRGDRSKSKGCLNGMESRRVLGNARCRIGEVAELAEVPKNVSRLMAVRSRD